nr:hypothetical protein Iba_chr02bCG8170 [Ipomoea batatas]GMC60161.1 hypothetical protein Iba_chr02bCG8180 [Ipomoea batatas]
MVINDPLKEPIKAFRDGLHLSSESLKAFETPLINVLNLILLPKHHPAGHTTQFFSSHGLKRVDLEITKQLQCAQLAHAAPIRAILAKAQVLLVIRDVLSCFVRRSVRENEIDRAVWLACSNPDGDFYQSSEDVPKWEALLDLVAISCLSSSSQGHE